MLHKEIFGLTILGFLLWVIFSADPSARITRVCKPVAWLGNGATSVSALVAPNSQQSVDAWFSKLDYGCRYSVWRLFYQEEYAAWEAQKGKGAPAESAEGSAPAPAPAPTENKPLKQDVGAGL